MTGLEQSSAVRKRRLKTFSFILSHDSGNSDSCGGYLNLPPDVLPGRSNSVMALQAFLKFRIGQTGLLRC